MYVADIVSSSDVPFPVSMYETLQSFQGIVNRDAPRLYVIKYPTDIHWLEFLESHYGISTVRLENALDVFKTSELTQYCKQMILYDSKECDFAVNNAVTLAGIYGCVVVDTQDLQAMQELGFSVHTDVRGLWKSKKEAQLWGFKNLRPQCNDTMFGVSRGSSRENKAIDKNVQEKMFVWCVDSKGHNVQDYETTQKDILASYSPPAKAIGWWSKEVPDIHAMSSFGHTMAGAGPNLSVFGHLKPSKPLKQVRPTTPLPEYDPKKTYIFISFTQGDSLHFCQKDNLVHLTTESAVEPGKLIRERYPFGLMHATLQLEFQPCVPEYLYSTQTPLQHFTAKGYGYANPTLLEENGHLDLWLEKSRTAMEGMDILDYMLNDTHTEKDPDHTVIKKIARVLRPRSIVSKHQLHPEEKEDDKVEVFDGVPVFGDPVFCRRTPEKKFLLEPTIEAIVASAKKRRFFYVFLQHTITAHDFELIADALKDYPDIVLLDQDTFIRLYLKQFCNQ